MGLIADRVALAHAGHDDADVQLRPGTLSREIPPAGRGAVIWEDFGPNRIQMTAGVALGASLLG